MRRLFFLILLFLILFNYTDQKANKRREQKFRVAAWFPSMKKDEASLKILEGRTKGLLNHPEHKTPEENEEAMIHEIWLVCRAKKIIISDMGRKNGSELASILAQCCPKKGRMTSKRFANQCRKPILKYINHLRSTPKFINERKKYLKRTKKKENKHKKIKRSVKSWNYSLLMRRVKRMAKLKIPGLTKAKRFAQKMNINNNLNGLVIRGEELLAIIQKHKPHRNGFSYSNDNHRPKRGVGEGLIAAMLILAALWFGYLALVCFFSILIPPFIFAMLLTVIFGGISWFCIKAAEGLLEGSMEDEYEGQYGSIEGTYDGYDEFDTQYGGATHFGEESVYDPDFMDLESGMHHSTDVGPNGMTTNTGSYGYSQIGGKRRRMGGFQGR